MHLYYVKYPSQTEPAGFIDRGFYKQSPLLYLIHFKCVFLSKTFSLRFGTTCIKCNEFTAYNSFKLISVMTYYNIRDKNPV